MRSSSINSGLMNQLNPKLIEETPITTKITAKILEVPSIADGVS
ncbi:hypothetical protein B6N60_00503 [Richelia sinica FACHB-800]|uniref:Uncharacterized protein n=1 Tax=Richelia sinica FACHB-800 TaxID=1357546 RepID=A0A975Y374_9NOST|nr:hypothetical protein B6N60_00503 [Richelia sinica FACHB-800]